jgi:16S rRNA (adenine1518-N6/adenine1519-N6)-dimethyltransferase
MKPLAEPWPLQNTPFDDLLRSAFSSRRKQLRNALPLAADDYVALNLDASSRPENLSPADYVRIAKHLASRGQ